MRRFLSVCGVEFRWGEVRGRNICLPITCSKILEFFLALQGHSAEAEELFLVAQGSDTKLSQLFGAARAHYMRVHMLYSEA